MDSQSSLSQSLEDVRDAYRLVWAYQHRVLDTVRLLAELFPDKTFYAWGNRMVAQPPQRTSSPFMRWSLDFMPIYNTSFLFLKPGVYAPKQGDWMLEIKLVTDADCEALDGNGRQPDLASLPPSQQSQSSISLVAWSCTNPPAGSSEWLKHVWDTGKWPDAESTKVDEPFLALDGIQACRVDKALEKLGTRQELEAFAVRAKARFKTVLGVE